MGGTLPCLWGDFICDLRFGEMLEKWMFPDGDPGILEAYEDLVPVRDVTDREILLGLGLHLFTEGRSGTHDFELTDALGGLLITLGEVIGGRGRGHSPRQHAPPFGLLIEGLDEAII